MYTFKTFFVLTVATYVIAAPPTEESAECKQLAGKEEEVSKCCNFEGLSKKEQAATKECFNMVKNKDAKGPLNVEGYECFDDCIMTKVGYLLVLANEQKGGLNGDDKKIDAAKVNAAVKATYTGDWAEPGPKIVEKCLAAAASKEKKNCTSGADKFVECTFRESYLNCPEKLWTNSDACKANKERLIKCPKSLPFLESLEKTE